MARGGGLWNADNFHEIIDADFPRLQQVQDAQPSLIREGPEFCVGSVSLWARHSQLCQALNAPGRHFKGN